MSYKFLGFDVITPLIIGEERIEYFSDTGNLSRAIVESTASRIYLTLTLAPDARGSHEMAAKLVAHRGKVGYTAFTIPMPQHLGITSPASATGTASKNAKSMTLNTSADVSAGTYFTVGTAKQVYVLTDDATAGGSVSVGISPIAQTALSGTVDFSPDITVRYRPGAPRSVQYTDGVITRATIELEEVVGNA